MAPHQAEVEAQESLSPQDWVGWFVYPHKPEEHSAAGRLGFNTATILAVVEDSLLQS